MPLTGAMRAWAVGLVLLVADVAAAAGIGLSQRQAGSGVGAPLIVLAGALVFFIPLVLAVWFRVIRTRAAFWAASVVPAILWVPALPAVFLRGGPGLATPSGLALAAIAIAGSVLVTVGGLLAMIEAAAAAPAPPDEPPAGADVAGADEATALREPAEMAVADIVAETAAAEPKPPRRRPKRASEADARAADDALVAELARDPDDRTVEPAVETSDATPMRDA